MSTVIQEFRKRFGIKKYKNGYVLTEKTMERMPIEDIEKFLLSSMRSLLDRVEREVVGQHEGFRMGSENTEQYKKYSDFRNQLRSEQRATLKKIRENL